MTVPFLYRIHEDPKEEKIQAFFQTIKGRGQRYGIKKVNHVHPKALVSGKLDEVEGEPEAAAVINTVLLRSMQKARYSEQSIGHYGPSTKFYTHFPPRPSGVILISSFIA